MGPPWITRRPCFLPWLHFFYYGRRFAYTFLPIDVTGFPSGNSEVYAGRGEADPVLDTEFIYLARDPATDDLTGYLITQGEIDYELRATNPPSATTILVEERFKADYDEESDAPKQKPPSRLSTFFTGPPALDGSARRALLREEAILEQAEQEQKHRRTQTSMPTIMILVSSAAAEGACGVPVTQACLDNFGQIVVFILNVNLVLSQVDEILLNVAEVNFVGTDIFIDGGTPLAAQQLQILEANAGFLPFRQRRVDMEIDFLSFVTETMTDFCGIGYATTNGRTAYQVTRRSCIPGFSFSHEVGHNMGLNHNREELLFQPSP